VSDVVLHFEVGKGATVNKIEVSASDEDTVLAFRDAVSSFYIAQCKKLKTAEARFGVAVYAACAAEPSRDVRIRTVVSFRILLIFVR